MALIDIHTHILYGVDDGAKDINDSMGLLDEEREQGVDQVILTPHYGPKFGHPDSLRRSEKRHTSIIQRFSYTLGANYIISKGQFQI